MTEAAKIARVKAFLPSDAVVADATITAFLASAKDEILAYMYQGRTNGTFVSNVPAKYENVQCMAVVAGLGLIGGVNETSHSENGVSRTFRYSDMVDYIHNHVFPIAEVR